MRYFKLMIFRKKNIFFLLGLGILLFSLVGCSLSDTSLQARLKKFYTFVNDQQIISDFKQGNLKEVHIALSNQLYLPTTTTTTNSIDLNPKQKQFKNLAKRRMD